jgi:hypothetical protein
MPDLTAARCLCPTPGPIVAVRPGMDAFRRGVVGIATRVDPLVEAPVADVVYCAACWPWRREVAA